uniref:Ground-like domain-containing protein n=1 Tax=Haemonchus placei TaxID=6290 RepID=A0A0N4W3A9_HAEPC
LTTLAPIIWAQFRSTTSFSKPSIDSFEPIQNVDSNPSSSKRKIQKAATDEIGGLFDVICSSHDFSYLANTQVFCEAGNDDVTCFAFLHSLIQ